MAIKESTMQTKIVYGIVLLALVGFFWKSLEKNPMFPKAMAQNTMFPHFELQDIREEEKTVTLRDVTGDPFVVHIWASWCGTCLKEHAFWEQIQNRYQFPLVGVLYRDKAQKGIRFLSARGDPYRYLLGDPSGALGVDLGLLGVPATYVVDGRGKIRYVHFGEVTLSDFEENILPHLQIAKPS